jgi:hypothetical protein
MPQQELLKKVVDILDRTGIKYMTTGSIVSSLQGEPRSTNDIDLVVNIKNADIRNLVSSINNTEYYLEEESIKEAIKNKDMFNLIDTQEGDKIDFWVLTDEPFTYPVFPENIMKNFMEYCLQSPALKIQYLPN